ncbi:hypothetical protein MAIT1_04238 [Magnetofaba australis IT-1]|uniref:Lipoprotein n=2 Tax=Magnetofaba TaxID=1472292 RepID=A0A1Y2K4V1_9PROT|nr:hypothetical protein MAIT1_04238 [Magnetofaba australis IT-1]
MILPIVALTLGSSLFAGCSANIRMPWERPMDASQVPTREPLEIPPNLDELPPVGTNPNVTKNPTALAAEKSAGQILFGGDAPSARKQEKPELGRDQQERLPGWINK